MKQAVIKLGGRQFTVAEGQTFEIERQSEFVPEILSYQDGEKTYFGTPFLKDVTVVLEKIEDKQDDKVTVTKFKAKSRYRRKVGHRQPISIFKVKSITK